MSSLPFWKVGSESIYPFLLSSVVGQPDKSTLTPKAAHQLLRADNVQARGWGNGAVCKKHRFPSLVLSRSGSEGT